MAAQRLEKQPSALTDQRRMRLDDHARQACDRDSDAIVVIDRHSAGIKEAAGVIQLDLADRLVRAIECLSRPGDLRGNRSARRVAFRGVPPEVAHHAAPWALAAGEEHGAHARDRSVGGQFVLDEYGVRLPGIVRRARWSPFENETISRSGPRRVERLRH